MPKLTTSAAPASLAHLVEPAREFEAHAHSPRTRVAYTRMWLQFTDWCEQHKVACMPASDNTISLYLTESAKRGLRPATVGAMLAAITAAHRVSGHPSPRSHPRVKDTMRGIARLLGSVQKGRDPLTAEQLIAMLDALPNGGSGLRDRALLLVGFLGGFRRSELCNMRVEHVAFTPLGLVIDLFGSKDDHRLVGRQVSVPRDPGSLCPLDALRAWMLTARINSGFVFRAVDRHDNVSEGGLSGGDVAYIVKRAAGRAGLDTANVSGHSLRAGFVTAAHRRGSPLESIMKVTGHKSYETAMRYIRKADLFEQHPSDGLLRRG